MRVNDSEIGATADLFRLERTVHTFDLSVALRMERGCRSLLQLQFRHEVQEVPRCELAPVIVDDTGVRVGVEFLRTGHEYLDVYRLHCREQGPDDDLAAEAGEEVPRFFFTINLSEKKARRCGAASEPRSEGSVRPGRGWSEGDSSPTFMKKERQGGTLQPSLVRTRRKLRHEPVVAPRRHEGSGTLRQ